VIVTTRADRVDAGPRRAGGAPDEETMADPALRWPENTPGRLFVDELCIDCDLCRSTAPKNFARSSNGYSYVAKQPATPAEEVACAQALAECPVEAIGDAQPATV
jgi:ferredoxin